MICLISSLRVSLHRTFFVVLVGFMLTIRPAFSSVALSAQESKGKHPDSALTQTTTAQGSKVKNPDAAITPTAFTYQGQLKDASGPVTGSFDFQFILYSAQTGGERLGATEMEDGSLTNGMFSFKLDFGRAAVEAKENWLEIGVRQGGSADDYTVLFPRQKLTPTPYAIFAQHEQWSLIGVPVGFAGRVEKATILTDELADQGVTEAKKVSEERAKSSDSLKGKVTDAESKSAVAPAAITAGSIPKFTVTGNASSVMDSIVVENNGNIGIGIPMPMLPASKLHIVSEGPGAPPPRLQSSGQGQNAAGLGGFQAGWDFYHGGTGKGYVGVPDTNTSFAAGEMLVFGAPNTKTSIWAGGQRSITVDTNANVGIGTAAPQARLDVAGRTITNVLQITGGNFDFSEEFSVTAGRESEFSAPPKQVQPGMVVRIDEAHPGELIVSTQAYDRRVAGIISGAGGIQPGLLMSQSSSLTDGSYPVALTGRVYCLVDASNGPIEPGDLLTTSDTPGHAMKATDHLKAHGAIIGKAMTGLERGKGLVLVLVMPQ